MTNEDTHPMIKEYHGILFGSADEEEKKQVPDEDAKNPDPANIDASDLVNDFYRNSGIPSGSASDPDDIKGLSSTDKQYYDNFKGRLDGLTTPFKPKFVHLAKYLSSKDMYAEYRKTTELKGQLVRDTKEADSKIYSHIHALKQVDLEKYEQVSLILS
jgi:hypothetical protein